MTTPAQQSIPTTHIMPGTSWVFPAIITAAALTGIGFRNFLLFHFLVEIFAVTISFGIFMFAWNTRKFLASDYLLLVGTSFLFVGCIDLLHTLAYRGMGVFPSSDGNLPTQLWIAGRFLESAGLLLAPLFVARRASPTYVIAGFGGAALLLVAAIFTGAFPACYVEGTGLTPFKKGSEIVVILLLLAALFLTARKRPHFDAAMFRNLCAALVFLAAAELSFTLYTDVYGITNMVGHLFKACAFYLIYRSVIETGLSRPYDLLSTDLKQSEERYRRLYESTPVMLHSFDRDGRILSVSDYWLDHLGYARDDVIGRRITDFLTKDSRAATLEQTMPKFLRNGVMQEAPCRVVRKDGTELDVTMSAAAEWNDAGRIVRSLAVMTDVTERKRAEERVEILNTDLAAQNAVLEGTNRELEDALHELATANRSMEQTNRELELANQELETFNFTVSHDLRAPLTGISGYSQLLLDRCSSRTEGECRDFIHRIHESAHRMGELITTLLEFSRLSRTRPDRVAVDLGVLATSIIAELRLRFPERKIVYRGVASTVAEGDPKLLRAVMENLLGNAWKYTGKAAEGVIEFGVDVQGGRTVYYVRDNGAGFDMELKERLFVPFQRLHDGEEFAGHGIGLATVQRIIQRHNGTIWAEGEVGKGATFYFTL